MEGCEVELVAVKPSERDEFMRMAEQHFREVSPAFTPHEDWKQSYFGTIMANPQLFLRWIVCGGVRSGFFLYGLEPHRFLPRQAGALYELYVAPEMRRRGVARQAGQIAIRELQQYGPSKIHLEIIAGDEGAAALWTSAGFKKITERYVLTAKL